MRRGGRNIFRPTDAIFPHVKKKEKYTTSFFFSDLSRGREGKIHNPIRFSAEWRNRRFLCFRSEKFSDFFLSSCEAKFLWPFLRDTGVASKIGGERGGAETDVTFQNIPGTGEERCREDPFVGFRHPRKWEFVNGFSGGERESATAGMLKKLLGGEREKFQGIRNELSGRVIMTAD